MPAVKTLAGAAEGDAHNMELYKSGTQQQKVHTAFHANAIPMYRCWS